MLLYSACVCIADIRSNSRLRQWLVALLSSMARTKLLTKVHVLHGVSMGVYLSWFWMQAVDVCERGGSARCIAPHSSRSCDSRTTKPVMVQVR
jgi:hypothetical protein